MRNRLSWIICHKTNIRKVVVRDPYTGSLERVCTETYMIRPAMGHPGLNPEKWEREDNLCSNSHPPTPTARVTYRDCSRYATCLSHKGCQTSNCWIHAHSLSLRWHPWTPLIPLPHPKGYYNIKASVIETTAMGTRTGNHLVMSSRTHHYKWSCQLGVGRGLAVPLEGLRLHWQ